MNKLVIVVILFIMSCGNSGGSNTPATHIPVISDMKISPTVAVQNYGGGAVSATISFNYRDAGSDMTSFTLNCYDSTNASCGSITQNFSSGSSSSGTAYLSFVVPTDTLGTWTAEVFVTDSLGENSNSLKVDFSVI